MADWRDGLNGDPVPWLLEPDPENPGVRYFALRDLLDRPAGDPEGDSEVRAARAAIMATGPVPAILDAQYPDGYWVKPGGGYSPKYRSTVWQILFLAELGADPADERVRRSCEYLLGHSVASNGAFSARQRPVPSGCIPCLNGNMLHALLRLGYADDARVQAALDWEARAIVGDESIQYLKSGTTGPGFRCSANGGLPCAWGANKVMRALLAIPPAGRTPVVRRAIEAGAEFLLSRDPAVADYPYTERVSSTWFKFGFPLSYWSDVLETTAVLAELGYGDDPRLANALRLVLSKQDAQGRWKLENALNGKMWADIEEKGKPSKWVTLRALRVLKRCNALLKCVAPGMSPESVLALLKGRRSIRRYRPDPVPDEMVEQLLEAGRWAPSASNRQPWAFIVVRDEAIRREVAQHAAYYFVRWAHVAEAPLLIVLCGDARHPVYRQFLHEDVGLAGSQIMLQAKALGLGTCWIGGLDRKAIAGILKVPDGMEIVGLLTVGFPAEDPEPRPRKPLAEIVHYDAYGNRGEGEGATPGRVPGGLVGNLLRRLRVRYRPRSGGSRQ